MEQVWNTFLDSIKYSDIVIYSAINTFSLTKMDENTIEIKYPSESSKEKFSKVEIDFLNLFKHKTQHYTISVEYKMDYTLKKEVETKRSIFERFLEINPLLKDLDQLVKFEFN